MKLYFFGLILFLIQSTICLSQDNRDYVVINLLIKKYSIKPAFDSSSFITELHFKSNPFEKEGKSDIWKYYLNEIDKLINKNIRSESHSISKRQIKKSFIKWESDKIDFSRIIQCEKDDFFYITKPIFISKEYFISVTYFSAPGGGISIVLFKYNEIKEIVERVDSYTISLHEIKWKT